MKSTEKLKDVKRPQTLKKLKYSLVEINREIERRNKASQRRRSLSTH